MTTAGRVRESVPDSPSHIRANRRARSRLWRSRTTSWAALVACCALGGCLLAYDYGDHRLADDASGGAGSGGGSGGQNCSIDEEPALDCQACLDEHCKSQLAACAMPVTCKPFAQCVIQCCEPDCFTDCGALTESDLKPPVNECICNFCEERCATVIPACPL